MLAVSVLFWMETFLNFKIFVHSQLCSYEIRRRIGYLGMDV